MKLVIINDQEVRAETIAKEILALVKEKPNAVLGLATGSSPIKTYQKVIELAKKENIDFSNVTSFNLDEYINNPDFTQSYRYYIKIFFQNKVSTKLLYYKLSAIFAHLFNFINIKKENTHFPSLEGLKTYDEEIKKAGGVDLQLLGIGADGHIGFNEPNTPFDSLTHIADLTEKTIQDNSRFFASIKDVPTQAVTRGRQSIRNAKKIILIATGKNKALAIEKTFGKVNEETPASLLNRHPDATIYCDEEAASLLKK